MDLQGIIISSISLIQNEETAMMLAAHGGHTETVKTLIGADADVDAINKV